MICETEGFASESEFMMADCPCNNDETQMCVPCKRTYACRGCWPAMKNVRKLDLCSECLAKKVADRSPFETVNAAITAIVDQHSDTYDHDLFVSQYEAVLKENNWTDLDFLAERLRLEEGVVK